MARVRGKNTSPERMLRSALWRMGLRYRLHARTLAGRPDIVFPSLKVAVFVDGCFWHGCPAHYSRPRSRWEFWAEKLAANVDRDRRQTLALEDAGWRVVRTWEHEVFSDVDRIVTLVASVVRGARAPTDRDWRVFLVTPRPDEGLDWEERALCLLRDRDATRSELGPRRTASSKRRLRSGDGGTR